MNCVCMRHVNNCTKISMATSTNHSSLKSAMCSYRFSAFLVSAWLVIMGLKWMPPSIAFQSVQTSTSSTKICHSKQSMRSWIRFSSKDEEIAKLEERLKELKEENSSEEIPENFPPSGVTAQEAERDVPIEMFLSEGWKEKEAGQSNGGGGGGGALTSILGVAALVIGLAMFSQIPIGQEDLSKYSAIKAPTERIDLGDLNRGRNNMADL
jgi:hypothetical protein